MGLGGKNHWMLRALALPCALLTAGCAAVTTDTGILASASTSSTVTSGQVGPGTPVNPVRPTTADHPTGSNTSTPIAPRPTLPTLMTARPSTTSTPADPCRGRPGRGFSASITSNAKGAPTAEQALSDFMTHPFETGYPGPTNRWHPTPTRDGINYTFAGGLADLSIVRLSNHTWIVIGGQTCVGSNKPSR